MNVKHTDFNTPLVCHEKIGDFQVTMNYKVTVKELETPQHLEHDAFHLRLGEWSLHVIQKAGQILFTVLHHQKYAAKIKHLRNEMYLNIKQSYFSSRCVVSVS